MVVMQRRTQRVNGLLRAEISELLKRQVKDPRLGVFVSVTEVRSSPDLRHAKVFVSILGSQHERKEALHGLAAASGFLRRQLGERLVLRRIPELDFFEDTSLEQGAHLLEVIRQVTAEDEAGKSGD